MPFMIFKERRREGRAFSRQNLNEHIETLHLAPMLFCHLPGITLFLSVYPLYLASSYLAKPFLNSNLLPI